MNEEDLTYLACALNDWPSTVEGDRFTIIRDGVGNYRGYYRSDYGFTKEQFIERKQQIRGLFLTQD